MLKMIGWSIWSVIPILVLAFHFGPGQSWLQRDRAVDRMKLAEHAESHAEELQAKAYETQLKTLAARNRVALEGSEVNDEHRAELEKLLAEEQSAYSAASDAWKETADRYHEVETLLEGTREANHVRWLRGRALVRAGEVFHGIDELQATLTQAIEDAKNDPQGEDHNSFVTATREELAAAHYYGARLLREEGRSSEVWRQVSEVSRQQFRYLAEGVSKQDAMDVAQNLQKNLERVLDLEQLDRAELVGKPIPKDSPRARRPGDGEPGTGRPGVGPPKGERPGKGASGMMEMGAGW